MWNVNLDVLKYVFMSNEDAVWDSGGGKVSKEHREINEWL